MTEEQNIRLTLFAENTQAIKGDFIWQSPMMKHMAALLYTAKDKHVDNEAIRQSFDMIKQYTGLFSMFRGNSILNIAAMLSLNDSREKYLSDTLQVYDALKSAGFWASDYLVIAAYQIATNTTPDRFQTMVFRAKSFYDGMKAQHPFLTSYDDYIFAAMLGLSDVEVSEGVSRMEQLYKALKPEFFSGNGVQTLAQVLILGERTSEVLDRVLLLKQTFRDRGLKMEYQYTLSTLGILSLLPGTVDDIVRDVIEAYEFLRAKKGFGAWLFPEQELELYAAALTAYEYVAALHNDLVTTTLSTSITNILIAQQAAVAATAASSAAAASAST